MSLQEVSSRDSQLVREALSRHGHGFHFAVVNKLAQLHTARESDWTVEAVEFPFEVNGQPGHADIVLRAERGVAAASHEVEGFLLRHTFASRLAMAGVGIRAIQEALGHKSIAMTVRYSHLSPDFLQDAVDKLVPQAPEEPKRTDTRTDTEALMSVTAPTNCVH